MPTVLEHMIQKPTVVESAAKAVIKILEAKPVQALIEVGLSALPTIGYVAAEGELPGPVGFAITGLIGVCSAVFFAFRSRRSPRRHNR